jgi:hypothetical protein
MSEKCKTQTWPLAEFYEPFGNFAWNLPRLGDFVNKVLIPTKGRGSEVDLMGAIYPLSIHRRIEQQWAERIKSPRQIRSRVVTATEQALQPVADSVQLDRPQPHD